MIFLKLSLNVNQGCILVWIPLLADPVILGSILGKASRWKLDVYMHQVGLHCGSRLSVCGVAPKVSRGNSRGYVPSEIAQQFCRKPWELDVNRLEESGECFWVVGNLDRHCLP